MRGAARPADGRSSCIRIFAHGHFPSRAVSPHPTGARARAGPSGGKPRDGIRSGGAARRRRAALARTVAKASQPMPGQTLPRRRG